MPHKSASPLLAVDDALDRILSALESGEPETIDARAAVGRVTATDVLASLTLPPHATSAMDGYAVRAADITALPCRLTRVGESAAGHPWNGTVTANQAVRIFTGAHLPDGADSIVLQEDCDAESENDGAVILVKDAPQIGRFIRPAGLDITAGAVALAAGTKITARGLALALSVGHTRLSVIRQPNIGILSTGDELVQPGDPLAEGQIISSNADYLAAFVTASGGIPVHLGIAADRPGAALEQIRATTTPLDLIVTTGGASVGTHDHIVDDLTGGGGTLNFWKIAMRPGKPLISGAVDGIPLIGLPGNPVSSAVCALVFLLPMIQKLNGGGNTPALIATELTTSLAPNDKRQDYLRTMVTFRDGMMPLSTPAAKQDSSMLGVLTAADGLLIRPPFDPARNPGDVMQVLLFPDNL